MNWIDCLSLAQLELASWLVNPGLFVAGALAVSLPIIIHLLNKRKFRVVDWAAMDFLLDADKKNRRRVRLENLILLLLRCLAVFLIGFLLARPFLPSAMTAGLIDSAEYERIVVLDDSLSMQVRQGNDATWDLAKKQVIDLLRGLAEQPSENKLTVLLTSDPSQRPFFGAYLGKDSIDEIVAAIEKWEPTDKVAQLTTMFQELDTYVSNQPDNVNRVVYVISDLRRRDWSEGEADTTRPTKLLEHISENCAGCFVVDVGDKEDRNILISEVRPEGTLVAGVASTIDVRVENAGSTEARDVKVRLAAGESLPLAKEIDRLAPGESKLVTFNTAFVSEEEIDGPLPPREVKIDVATAAGGIDDRLTADSVAYFPARIVPGIPTLLVDGDPSSEYGRAESFYLKRALSPRGAVLSGITPTVATEQELESLTLNNYQAILFCNIYRLGDRTDELIRKLEQWVRQGGGLVLLPGDQVDEHFFNENFFREGNGLSPLRLEEIRGDETETTWVKFRVDQAKHPVLGEFAGQNNPFLEPVKIFRYWHATVKEEQAGSDVAILARWNDADESIAIAEKPFGKGRVLAFTIPADADWSNWPSDPSYVLAMEQLVRYLIGNQASPGQLRVGQPLQQPLDLANYELDATLHGPGELQTNLQAAPLGSAPSSETNNNETPEKSTADPPNTNGPPSAETDDSPPALNPNSIWKIAYAQTNRQGFYQLDLQRRDGLTEPVLFGVNVDPAEGNLRRIDPQELQREVGEKVRVLSRNQAAALGDLGETSELWWYLLLGLAGVLGIEQFLGWWFGRRR